MHPTLISTPPTHKHPRPLHPPTLLHPRPLHPPTLLHPRSLHPPTFLTLPAHTNTHAPTKSVSRADDFFYLLPTRPPTFFFVFVFCFWLPAISSIFRYFVPKISSFSAQIGTETRSIVHIWTCFFFFFFFSFVCVCVCVLFFVVNEI